MRAFHLRSSANGYPTFARPAPDYVNAKALSAGANEDETVPSGAKFVVFSATADFYAKRGGTAAVPGDVSDGSASELNPSIWQIDDITTIGLIAPATTVVTMSYYSGGGAP